ncbi:hypothetical protein KCP76_25245 [Salmonella enterica subsp. enterica serovar Weltevreden]|nr:hypothetical protein KCP76_25245 [Salmonella enterica subsp. enterica serovar Weltevreden]
MVVISVYWGAVSTASSSNQLESACCEQFSACRLHSLRAGPFHWSIHSPTRKSIGITRTDVRCVLSIGYQQRYTCALMNSPSPVQFWQKHMFSILA